MWELEYSPRLSYWPSPYGHGQYERQGVYWGLSTASEVFLDFTTCVFLISICTVSILDPVDIECDMTSHPSQVVSIVHHNSEAFGWVRGFEAPASFRRNLSYFASFPHMLAIR